MIISVLPLMATINFYSTGNISTSRWAVIADPVDQLAK